MYKFDKYSLSKYIKVGYMSYLQFNVINVIVVGWLKDEFVLASLKPTKLEFLKRIGTIIELDFSKKRSLVHYLMNELTKNENKVNNAYIN